jgi:putative hydrolase of the HAD superfamily
MAIRTIIFDFGNVIAHFSHRRAAEQVAAYGPGRLLPEALLQFMFLSDLEPRFEVSGIGAAEVLDIIRKEFALAASDDDLYRAFSDMFTANREVCDLVPLLKQSHRLLLLSNTNEMHFRWIKSQFAWTLGFFDHLIASHEVRMRKPDPALYRHAHELAACAPGEVLFIDDLPANIAAGREQGWHTIHYTPMTDLPTELTKLGVAIPRATP